MPPACRTVRDRTLAAAAALAVCLAVAVSHAFAAEESGEPAGAVTVLEQPIVFVPLEGYRLEEVEVFIGDWLATDFATVGDGGLVVEIPFAGSPEPFLVLVRDARSEKTLFSAGYRFAAAPAVPEVAYNWSVEENAVGTLTRRGAATNELRHDFHAAGDIAVSLGDFKIGGLGALFGTNVRENTLREGGPQLDLERGLLFAGYDDERTRAQASLGDVEAIGYNELVNAGMASRGLALSTSLLDGRVKVQGAQLFGADIVGSQEGLGLSDNSFRRAADGQIVLIKERYLTVTAGGSHLKVERPDQGSFNVGEVTQGEQNLVRGASLEVALFDDRVRARSDIAWSAYTLTDAPPTQHGKAQRHTVEVALWRGDNSGETFLSRLEATARGSYAWAQPRFQSVQGTATPDQRSWEAGLALDWGGAHLDLHHLTLEDNVDRERATRFTTRSQNDGAAVHLDLTELKDGIWQPASAGDPEVTGGGGEETDLAEPVRPPWWHLIPAAIELTGERTAIGAYDTSQVLLNPASFVAPQDLPKSVTEATGAALIWSWPDGGETTVSLARTIYNEMQLGRETADSRDRSVTLEHGFYGDAWDVSASLTRGRLDSEQVGARAEERRYEVGLDLTLRPETLPDLFLTYTYSILNTKSVDLAIEGSESEHRIQSGLDFTKYLPLEGVLPAGLSPYVKLLWTWQRTALTASGVPAVRKVRHSLDLAVGFSW